MHIADGVLSAQVLGGGAVLALAGIGAGLRKIDHDDMPKVAMLSAAFFVASLIHVPVGPGQVHLLLNGLVGIILGWAAFPALFIGLLLQALLFGYGGVTVLGVNTVIMAGPALLVYLAARPLLVRVRSDKLLFLVGSLAGGLATLLSGLLLGLGLYLSDKGFLTVVGAILLAHLPVMLIEGPLVGFAVVFLKKVRPEIVGLGVARAGEEGNG